MINGLQIIVHLPLLHLNFPVNALIFFSSLMKISYFDLLPSDKILGYLFTFADNKPFNDEFEAMDIF